MEMDLEVAMDVEVSELMSVEMDLLGCGCGHL